MVTSLKLGKWSRKKDGSPSLTAVATEIGHVYENPSNEKNSQRLSAMEKNEQETNRRQAETNRRLADVMKSNVDLQKMLQFLLSAVSPNEFRGHGELGGDPTTHLVVASGSEHNMEERRMDSSGGNDISKNWWDRSCSTSDEEDHSCKRKRNMQEPEEGMQGRPMNQKSKHREKEESEKEDEEDIQPKQSTAQETQEQRVGDRVWLADTLNPDSRVARGTVMGMSGVGLFHNCAILPKYVRVNLHSVDVNIPLMIPVEDAEQVNLKDALGSSVHWFESLTFFEA